MGFEIIKPLPKAKSRSVPNEEYVRLTNKMLFINACASKYLRSDYIIISIDPKRRLLKFTPCEKNDENAFKLSSVNETNGARRIETNRALQSIQDAGFPSWKLGKRLPVSVSLDGAMLVDYDYRPASAQDRACAAEKESEKRK